VERCNHVSNDGIINGIGNMMENLKELSLRGCNKITDNGIRQLFHKPSPMQTLCLSFCDKITDKAIEVRLLFYNWKLKCNQLLLLTSIRLSPIIVVAWKGWTYQVAKISQMKP
jgi:hypothetical protein